MDESGTTRTFYVRNTYMYTYVFQVYVFLYFTSYRASWISIN